MTDIPTSNRNWPRDIPVLVMTYQQVVNRAEAVARLATEDVPTLVVFDEIHHAGDENTWGTRLKAAFRSARKRLLLTGTAFRNDGQAIPYVRYDPRSQRVQPDFSLDYATALRHGYVAPLYFHTYDAEGRWTKGDDEFEASFGDRLSQEQASYLLNTAITRPAFVKKIVGDAHERLNALRQAGHADAGGLIVTRDQAHARDVAGRPTPGTPPGRDGRGGFSIQPICERKGIMQIPLPNTVILSREAAAVLKRARAAWAAPTEDAGVWAIVADTEAEAADALAAAGLIVEEYSFVRGRMMAAITGAGMVALLVYEEQERAQQNGGAR